MIESAFSKLFVDSRELNALSKGAQTKPHTACKYQPFTRDSKQAMYFSSISSKDVAS